MLAELASKQKVVGVKQCRKAIRDGRAKRVYLACDADPVLVDPIAEGCVSTGIPVEREYTMAQLGRVCCITVGAAAVAVLE